MIHLLLANDFHLSLGGPFYGRFYTITSSQRKKLEQFHSILLTAFGLVSIDFPEFQDVKLGSSDGSVTARDASSSPAKFKDSSYFSLLPLDRFESLFAKISSFTQNEMADLNSVILLCFWIVALFALFIPVFIFEQFHFLVFNNFFLFDLLAKIIASIYIAIPYIAMQDMARNLRHSLLPSFSSDQLKFNFAND